MKTPKTLVIIGNGIASWRVNAALERKFVDWRIVRIAKDEFAPRCSFRTTAINCLRATQKGISPLGDIIVDSYMEFKRFYDSESPDGVDESFEYQIWDPKNPKESERWEKRFGKGESIQEIEGVVLARPQIAVKQEAYIISPENFCRWQDQRLKNTMIVNDHVIGIEKEKRGYQVKTIGGESFFADALFLCAGYMSHQFIDLFESEQAIDVLNRSKPVRGSYMSAESKLGDRSFSLAFGKHHLIYRKRDDLLILGSSSENDSSIQLPMEDELLHIYRKISGILKDPSLLPPFEKWRKFNGIRHKGAKRMPFWGEVGENLYAVHGLYKNAFSFSFLASNEIVDKFASDSDFL